jgi:hypothetical protein
MSGVVAASRLVRVATVFGFASAASYIVARLLTATPRFVTYGQGETTTTPNHPHLSTLWNSAWLLGWVALLVLLGAIFVPAFRALRTDGAKRPERKALLAGLTVALVAFALVVPILAAWRGGHFGLEQLLGTPDADGLPNHGSVAILAIILGTPVLYAVSSGAIPGTAWLQGLIDRRVPVSTIYAALSVLVLAWSLWKISHHVTLNWRVWAVASAGLATALFAVYITHGVVKGPKNPMTLPSA